MKAKQPRGRGETETTAGDLQTGKSEGPAWEEVATGRYMPRRIKGSCKGRALG
jgi:hypothetical protein